jgi:hypothetical protein
MADPPLVKELVKKAKGRNKRLVDILTTFFSEASVLIFVFGILDTYASGKLSVMVAAAVACAGSIFFLAALGVQRWFDYQAYWKARRIARIIDDAMGEEGT